MRYLIAAALAVLLSTSASFADPAGTDQSTGAKEQSSAPPSSGAAKDSATKSSEGASSDTSTGAKEQSSAPPDSAAATGQPSNSGGTQTRTD
jgi:hypothetical protein